MLQKSSQSLKLQAGMWKTKGKRSPKLPENTPAVSKCSNRLLSAASAWLACSEQKSSFLAKLHLQWGSDITMALLQKKRSLVRRLYVKATFRKALLKEAMIHSSTTVLRDPRWSPSSLLKKDCILANKSLDQKPSTTSQLWEFLYVTKLSQADDPDHSCHFLRLSH